MRHEEGSLPGWGWEHKETDIYKVGSAKHRFEGCPHADSSIAIVRFGKPPT